MRSGGYTLLELLVVVLIVGTVAGALLVRQTSVDSELLLDAAAEEAAAAFRFARSEAMRTGEPHGVVASQSTQRLRVYRLDTSASPPSPQYTVRHPVDKQLYTLDFDSHALLEPVDITDQAFWYEDVGFPSPFLGFSESGTPKYEDAAGAHMLASGSLTLAAGGRTRTISIAPMTGRVSVQ